MARLLTLVLSLCALAVPSTRVRAAENSLPWFCKEQNPAANAWSETSYKARGRGAFCDGDVFVPHSGQMAVLSIMGSTAQPVATGSPVVLKVSRTSLPGEIRGKPILLHGASPNGAYRFDAALAAPQDAIQITSDAALSKKKLNARDVAWLASIADYGGFPVFIPVCVDASCKGVSIVVRPTLIAVSVTFEVRAGDKVIQSGEAKELGDGLYEVRADPSLPAFVTLSISSNSPAGDIESTTFHLVAAVGISQ